MVSISVTSRPSATVGTKGHTTDLPGTALPWEMRAPTPGGTVPRWVHAGPQQWALYGAAQAFSSGTKQLSCNLQGFLMANESQLHPSLGIPFTKVCCLSPKAAWINDWSWGQKGLSASRQDCSKGQLWSKAPYVISEAFGCSWILVLILPSAKFYFL